MAAKNRKVSVELLLAGAELGGIKLQPHLVKTTRLVTVDVACPRASIAKKSAAKEVKFQKAKAKIALKEFRDLAKAYTVGICEMIVRLLGKGGMCEVYEL